MGHVFVLLFWFLDAWFSLSIPVQLVACEGLCSKWPAICRVGC